MRDLVKNLFAVGVTFGLSDREAFVKQVSGYIKEYQDDPAKAERWAKVIVDYLEGMKNDINLQRSLKNSMSGSDLPHQENIEELTQAIKKLTEEMQHSRGNK